MYFEKDHLGSTRTVLNASGTVIEKNDYYPFGLRHANSAHTLTANNRYKFNGKEEQVAGSLGVLDYGARMYDGQIGRWLNMDPLAEKYYSTSPYIYCLGNPVRFIDPDGKVVNIANNTEGALKNLAKIVATTYGQKILNSLIKSQSTYKMKSVFWSGSSKYENETVYYVENTWLSSIDGGSASNEVIMGHETYHAYQDESRQISWYKGKIGNVLELERGAVGFENYLRSVYGDTKMRVRYNGLVGGEEGKFRPLFFNLDQEKIANFTHLGNNEKKTSFGFSFEKKSAKSDTSKYYLIVSSDENNNFNYQLYSDEEEYKKAILNW